MGPESTNGKIVGVIFFSLIFVFGLSLSLSLSLSFFLSLSLTLSPSTSLSLSISLSLSLSPLSLSFSLSLSLSPIINISDEAPHISCGRFPWKTERDGTGVNKRENCRGNFFCLIFVFGLSLLSLSLTLTLSLSLSLSLSLYLSLSISLSLSLSRYLSLSLSLSLIIIYMHICAWQSADSRVTTDHCRVTLRWVFTKSFQITWNVQKRCLTVSQRSRDLRPLSRDRSATFFKNFSNCLKRPKTLFDSRPTVAWPPTTVAWPFSDFFQNFPKSLETSKKRCLTVGRRSRDLRPLSRDRSGTFFKIFPNCLKRPKNVVWQSADGRVTSDHCRVTVQRLFSKFSQIAWNVQKTLFDSRPTVAWPPTTVAWPFSDYFQSFPKLLETSKKRCLTVSRRSRDLRPLSRDRSATFFKIFPNRLKRLKTLFDSRPTVAWPPTTVAWPFSDFFQNVPKLLETSKKRCLTVSRRSRDLRPPSRDRSATFFKIFPNRLKRPKNVVWQSADGRVTSDHCCVTVQRLFSKFSQIAWNVQKTLFDSQPTVAWPPTTVAWPFSDFFQNFPKSLETSKKRCLTVGRRSRDLRPLSRDRSATFFKKISNCLKRRKIVVWQSADSRVTSDHCRVTVSATFFKNISNCLKRPKNVVWQSADGRVSSTTVAWPFRRLFFQNFPKLLEKSKKCCLTVSRRSRDLRPLSRDRSATFFKKNF